MGRLGFLGLGIMGYPMACNLLRGGHQVAVWSHTPAKAQRLAAEEGGVFCATPRQVAAQAECLFLCVGDTRMSESTLLGPEGVIAGAAPELIVADASTISPSRSREFGRRLAEHGVRFLDAPCTGSKLGAEASTLTFMVGGEQATGLTQQMFQAALSAGLGEEDMCSTIKLLEGLADTEVRAS